MMMIMIIIVMMTSTTAMMIISMGNARNNRGIWITGVRISAGQLYWLNKTELRRPRDHVLTVEELDKDVLLLPALPTPHVSEYRLSHIPPVIRKMTGSPGDIGLRLALFVGL
jgi:hypothetical protein